jgi:hypothetical protein
VNENILAWNVTNWITVILMAAVGFFLLGLALKWKQAKLNSATASTNTTQTGVQSLAG